MRAVTIAPPKHDSKAGKWLVFVLPGEVDALWTSIASAVQAGHLGPAAKVSTRLRDPAFAHQREHVICVYTEDARDEADVRRVRDALRRIGITESIPYKTDDQTLAGLYAGSGLPRLRRE